MLVRDDRIRARDRAYYHRTIERQRAQARAHYARHRAARLAYAKSYNERERPRRATYIKAYYAKHREELKAKRIARGVRHPERAVVRARAWSAAHPDATSANQARYRARKQTADGDYTGAEWAALLVRFEGCCGYCGERKPLTADHRTPLSRGGSHRIDNIIPACRNCNSRKRHLTESEFRARLAA